MTDYVLAKTLKYIGGQVTDLGDSGNRGDIAVAVLVLVTDSADNLEEVTRRVLISRSIPLVNNGVLKTLINFCETLICYRA